MNDSNAFGYQEEKPPLRPINPAQYRFSKDELKVLEECNRESFFQRSVPLGTLLGLGTYAAVQTGRLRPNPKYGAFPKMSLAVVIGYFIGKISYQQACAEKLMALPGSYIGQLLRDRRDGKLNSPTMPSGNLSSMLGANPSDIYSDAGPGSSLDLDTHRPAFDADMYRPDSDGGDLDSSATSRPIMSYDELRRRNRSQYSDTRQDPYRLDPGPSPAINRSPPPPTAPPTSRPTNKYGDDME
ncbi:hypothetical protein ACJJTC_017857 [Scirpophaga incertulas]